MSYLIRGIRGEKMNSELLNATTNQTSSSFEASLLSLESEISKLKLELLRQEFNSKLQSLKIHLENKKIHSFLKNQTNSTQFASTTKKNAINLKSLSSALYIKVFDTLEMWQLIFILLITWIVLIMVINCIQSRIALRKRTRKAQLLKENLEQGSESKPNSVKFFDVAVINEELKYFDSLNSRPTGSEAHLLPENSFLSTNQSTTQLDSFNLEESTSPGKSRSQLNLVQDIATSTISVPHQQVKCGPCKQSSCRRSQTTYSKRHRCEEKKGQVILGFEGLESSLRRSQPNINFY